MHQRCCRSLTWWSECAHYREQLALCRLRGHFRTMLGLVTLERLCNRCRPACRCRTSLATITRCNVLIYLLVCITRRVQESIWSWTITQWQHCARGKSITDVAFGAVGRTHWMCLASCISVSFLLQSRPCGWRCSLHFSSLMRRQVE